MDLVLFGIQGSGKGTQARRLAEEFDFYLFEAGGELRKIAASGSDLGNTVKGYIDEGHLVPFEIIMQVMEEAVASVPADRRIIFDGIPRDSDQMRAFDGIMERSGRGFSCIQILLTEEEAMERIRGRASEEGRADDADEEKVRRRMELFKEKTLPVIRAYKEQGKLTEIDGNASVDEVYEAMRKTVED